MYQPVFANTVPSERERTAPSINSYCIVLTKDKVSVVPLDNSYDYNTAITNLRQYVGLSMERKYETENNELYNKLIKPVLPMIEGKKNIVIVPDGQLAFLPFDILREDKWSENYFGKDHVITYSPSVSVSIFEKKRATKDNSSIIIFADAVYNDTKIEKFNHQWPQLTYSLNEANSIKAIAKQNNIDARTLFKWDASEEKIKQLSQNGELKKYPILHFACHGIFNKEYPEYSGIVLSDIAKKNAKDDGYLSIPEIASLNIDARIAVLSACETGLAENIKGEGMVGVTRAFMAAGAGSVGVSLWNIHDQATSLFMEEVYKEVLTNNRSFRDAYHLIKTKFRNNEYGKFKGNQYWAAFVLYE
jgi:CHAT domain-containing protein